MKKQLALILLIAMVCMSILPMGAAFAENATNSTTDKEGTTATATTSGNGESSGSVQNAKDKNIFKNLDYTFA